MRLVAEHRDFKLRRVLQNLLDARNARHSVPDDHEPFHQANTSTERLLFP
jgi:hypothetical protein